jgi:hypothetical protein
MKFHAWAAPPPGLACVEVGMQRPPPEAVARAAPRPHLGRHPVVPASRMPYGDDAVGTVMEPRSSRKGSASGDAYPADPRRSPRVIPFGHTVVGLESEGPPGLRSSYAAANPAGPQSTDPPTATRSPSPTLPAATRRRTPLARPTHHHPVRRASNPGAGRDAVARRWLAPIPSNAELDTARIHQRAIEMPRPRAGQHGLSPATES